MGGLSMDLRREEFGEIAVLKYVKCLQPFVGLCDMLVNDDEVFFRAQDVNNDVFIPITLLKSYSWLPIADTMNVLLHCKAPFEGKSSTVFMMAFRLDEEIEADFGGRALFDLHFDHGYEDMKGIAYKVVTSLLLLLKRDDAVGMFKTGGFQSCVSSLPYVKNVSILVSEVKSEIAVYSGNLPQPHTKGFFFPLKYAFALITLNSATFLDYDLIDYVEIDCYAAANYELCGFMFKSKIATGQKKRDHRQLILITMESDEYPAMYEYLTQKMSCVCRRMRAGRVPLAEDYKSWPGIVGHEGLPGTSADITYVVSNVEVNTDNPGTSTRVEVEAGIEEETVFDCDSDASSDSQKALAEAVRKAKAKIQLAHDQVDKSFKPYFTKEEQNRMLAEPIDKEDVTKMSDENLDDKLANYMQFANDVKFSQQLAKKERMLMSDRNHVTKLNNELLRPLMLGWANPPVKPWQDVDEDKQLKALQVSASRIHLGYEANDPNVLSSVRGFYTTLVMPAEKKKRKEALSEESRKRRI